MNITISNVNVVNKGKYTLAEVSYLTQEGKQEKKNVASFGNKELYKTFTEAKSGEVYEVTLGKNDKGYWEFTTATRSTSAPVSKTSATATPRSTYETPEERANRQVLIVRQSSVSSAISLLSIGAKSAPKVDDVIEVAKRVEAFVFGREDLPHVPQVPLSEFVDDLPTVE